MKQQGKDIGLCLCKVCRQLNSSDLTHCQRCEAELHVRDYSSLQKSWALLITAAILLVPANIYPITMLTNQGQVRHDTIFSGILHLVHSDMLPIAVIVFTASILVPWIKIIGLSIYLCAISFDIPISKKKLMNPTIKRRKFRKRLTNIEKNLLILLLQPKEDTLMTLLNRVKQDKN